MAVDWIKARRDRVKALTGHEIDWPEKPIGLAFSGGGIRSATLSLGITQALARRDRLYAFDYLSTVSGGGYLGVFLRGLFLPQSLRGTAQFEENPDATKIAEAFDTADQVLRDGPSAKTFPSESEYKHPVRWLRENGRYLAPTGSQDLFFGLSYIARNWLAMLYVFALAMAGLFFVAQAVVIGTAYLGAEMLEWGGSAEAAAQLYQNPWIAKGYTLSPFLFPAAITGFVGFGVGVAYWLTEGMGYNPDPEKSPWDQFVYVCGTTAIAAIVGGYIIQYNLWPSGPERSWARLSEVQLWVLMCAEAVLVIALVAAVLTAGWYLLKERMGKGEDAPPKAENPTPTLRRWLTRGQARINFTALMFLILGLIDTAAIAIREGKLGWDPAQNPFGFFTLLLYPAAAFLIKKIPDWASGVNNALLQKLTKNINLVAFVAGCMLFGSLALMVNVIVHMAIWQGASWASMPFGQGALVFALVVAGLAVLTGASGEFINLSSLHPLYASRLTRAYIGASNDDRLAAGTGLTDGHPKDHIDSRIYHETALPIAWHLVNLTLNVTKGDRDKDGNRQANSIVHQDRKGQRFVIGPGGISIDSPKIDYGFNSKAERLSIGQQCAISGAAASSGMGRRTSIGTALALTYANVRLGYWWNQGFDASKSGRWEGIKEWVSHYRWQPFGTFIYLFKEMTAGYATELPRLYLTDGGHSENSGALALLERDCGFILVADNGQDPEFTFSDLEIFIRTARTDLGYDVKVARPKEVEARYGRTKKKAFLNSSTDWRESARSSSGSGYALLLTAWKIDDERKEATTIIWLKPRLFDGLPSDIATYAEENKPFPHQTTVDQFFDEAQWESYRRLGYEMVRQLFDANGQIAEVPVIVRSPPLKTPPPNAPSASV